MYFDHLAYSSTGHQEPHTTAIGAGDRKYGRSPKCLHLCKSIQIDKRIQYLIHIQRENTVYYAKCFNSDVPASVNILSDILQNSKLEPQAIERERDVILREQEEVDKQLEEVVFDHLHATAFQGQPLGRTILGPKENIATISRDDLTGYIKQNYLAERMVLVGSGGIPHRQLVDLAEKHFSNFPKEPASVEALENAAAQKAKPDFVGSEVRMRDDTIPTAHIAIAVEGVSWKDDDYFTALVTQAIVGNWDRAMGNSPYLGSKLSSFIFENKLANSFMSFSTSYSDTGYVILSNSLHPFTDFTSMKVSGEFIWSRKTKRE